VKRRQDISPRLAATTNERTSLTSQAEQFNQRNIDEFRTNDGRVGGTFAGAPLLLLHTVGARGGQQRINPMMYLADGDNYLVFASKAGSDRQFAGSSRCRPAPGSCSAA
jgi:hypothetical protein